MKTLILLMLSVFMGLISPVWASYISLNTTVSTKVEQEVLKVSVKVINQGDESAHNVQAEVRIDGKANFGKKQAELGINQTYVADLTFDLDLETSGLYPLVLIMHYTDANNYPFSALTAQTFTYGSQEIPSEIFGKLSAKNFWKRGKVKLTLKNLSESEINAKAYLVSPREITVEDELVNISLPPKGSKSLSFSVNNFSALSGSSYQVYAVAEYEKDGIHQASMIPAVIKIIEKNFFVDYKMHIIIFVSLLIIVFLLFQFKKN
jgi:hypothetical protein